MDHYQDWVVIANAVALPLGVILGLVVGVFWSWWEDRIEKRRNKR